MGEKGENWVFGGGRIEDWNIRAGSRLCRDKRKPPIKAARAATANMPHASRARLLLPATTGDRNPDCESSTTQRSSLAMSPADRQRSSGSFARQVLTTRSSPGGVIGCSVAIGGGSDDMIAVIKDAWLDAAKAFFPVAIS